MKYAVNPLTIAGLAVAVFCLPAPVSVAQASAIRWPACEDMQVALYFQAYQTGLSTYSERILDAASDRLKGCDVTAVRLSVLSEEAHTDEDMAALSEARAESVLNALIEHGIDRDTVQTDFSAANAGSGSAPAMAEPMARRVNVAFATGTRPGV